MRILPLLLAGAALGAQTVRVRAWVGAGKEPSRFLDFRLSEAYSLRVPLFQPKAEPRRDRVPGAVVEVWGDAAWVRQDAFKAFVRANLPAFRSAFDAGTAASIGGDLLADLMSRPGDLHGSPLVMSPVWFNATDPWARDKRFFK